MKTIRELTINEVNLLVAKLEGVEVEIYTNRDGIEYVTEKLPFSPEGPANVFPAGHNWMFKFYEPTKDWSIAGAIIERERICVIFSDKTDGVDQQYAWSYYVSDDGEMQYEQDGDTGLEAAMRSFVCKHFGDTIDLQNLPSKIRTAVISVNGLKTPDLMSLRDEDIVFLNTTVEAETSAEAERLAMEKYKYLHDVMVNFIRWQ